MRDTAYLLLLDGFADWEAALAASEIGKADRFVVRTAGRTREPVRSMGGVTALPDLTVAELDFERACVLLVPGGTSWEAGEDVEISELLRSAHDAGVPIAALCGATLGLARAGLLRGRRHTSNMRGYLASLVPGYGDESDYVDSPAVRDGDVITASGMGGVEFAYEVIRLLDLYDEQDREVWLTIFRDKKVPEGVAGGGGT